MSNLCDISLFYYIIDKLDPNNDNGSYYKDETGFYNGRVAKDEAAQNYKINLPWNYELYKEGTYLDVYKNTSYIGIGYTVDDIIESSTIGKYKESTLYEEAPVDSRIFAFFSMSLRYLSYNSSK